MAVFLFQNLARHPISSLASVLGAARLFGNVMRQELMALEDVVQCRWVGYRFSKGVTSCCLDMTVLAGSNTTSYGHGMHADILRGVPGVDEGMACYEPDSKLGFGDFVRWVLFIDPSSEKTVVGVDFSIAERPTAGVAHTMLRVAKLARKLLEHGLPQETELVLLNPRMVEEDYHRSFREENALIYVVDWREFESTLTGVGAIRCPRCGLVTRGAGAVFCNRCGCKFCLVDTK